MLKMKKILGISLVLLFLLSVTATAVSASTWRNAPPDARLDATKNPWIGYQARIGTKITLTDKSKGTITGKKWYVDGNIYSKSMAKKITYTTYTPGYHTFQIKVGNGSGSTLSNIIYYHFYSY